MNKSVEIGGVIIKPGERKQIDLPIAHLYTHTDMSIPVTVINGKKAGPSMFISAAIHGDELNGIEIIRRLMNRKSLNRIRGTLILVPIVNVYGVLNHSRYLPDRRDLNRSFPGSPKGSLAGRIANLFLKEIVHKCDYGIDLHTGALHRSNLPQIRANLDDPETQELAKAFGVPVLLNSDLRDGSLRAVAADEGIKILLYEAGEALRFDELAIRAGVNGVMNVLRILGIISSRTKPTEPKVQPYIARSSSWLRAPGGGFVHHIAKLGQLVEKDSVLAEINSVATGENTKLLAHRQGIVIGRQNIPLVLEGEAMYHIGLFSKVEKLADHMEQWQEEVLPEEAPVNNEEKPV